MAAVAVDDAVPAARDASAVLPVHVRDLFGVLPFVFHAVWLLVLFKYGHGPPDELADGAGVRVEFGLVRVVRHSPRQGAPDGNVACCVAA